MMIKDSPDLRDQILRHLENRSFARANIPEAAPAEQQRAETTPDMPEGTAIVVARAARAFARWARSGFKATHADVVERRWAACQACDHLADPPYTMLYQRLTLLTDGAESKIGGACGCLVLKKVALFTEACPRENPAIPGLTNWGEPVKR